MLGALACERTIPPAAIQGEVAASSATVSPGSASTRLPVVVGAGFAPAEPPTHHGDAQAAVASPDPSGRAEAGTTTGEACSEHQTFLADLGDLGTPLDRVTWRRCARPDPSHPLDQLVVRMRGADETPIYTNEGDELVEGLGQIEALRLQPSGNELLYVVQTVGSGNIWAWTVVDWREGRLRTWNKPDERPSLERLRRPNERIQHQVGAGPVVRGPRIELAYLIYEGPECAACASGGVAKLELLAGDGAFRVARAWREANH